MASSTTLSVELRSRIFRGYVKDVLYSINEDELHKNSAVYLPELHIHEAGNKDCTSCIHESADSRRGFCKCSGFSRMSTRVMKMVDSRHTAHKVHIVIARLIHFYRCCSSYLQPLSHHNTATHLPTKHVRPRKTYSSYPKHPSN